MFGVNTRIANGRHLQLALNHASCCLRKEIRPAGQLSCQERWASTKCDIKDTCLIGFHKTKQARMEQFAGYRMPIVYKNQTIKSEHLHTRTSATIFDVSHMLQTEISGDDRHKFVESLTVTDLNSLGLNKCALSVFTNSSGGILDDCIIAKRSDRVAIVSNAGNKELIWSWLNTNAKPYSNLNLNRLDDQGLIALQGPKAKDVLQKLVTIDLTDLVFMSTVGSEMKNIGTCQITRCGYTGEDGFEISVDSNSAEKLMNLLNEDTLVVPAGLGARDTLRLEAGLCLHGHDITSKTSPIEAGLAWTVNKLRREQGGFPGYEVIMNHLKGGLVTRRTGLVAIDSGPPAREGSEVIDSDGSTKLGLVTSGNFAPSLEKNIAMAYVPSKIWNDWDRRVFCNIRGKNFEYKITRLPFVKSNYYIKK